MKRILLTAAVLVALLTLAAFVAMIWLATAATWEFDPDIQARLAMSSIGCGVLMLPFGLGTAWLWMLGEDS